MREKRWLLCFLVAVCCTFSTWALPSQDKTVTLNLHNVSIETVLDAVKKQTGVNMLYNSQMFKGVPPVSINVKNEKWEVALKLILNPQGFDYGVKDGIVVVRKLQAEKRSNRIRGTVIDSNKEPIPGASIIVKGTRTGTSTNIEGEFTLDVKDDKVILEISFIGMKKQTLQVDATRKKALEITLVDDVKTLDDVVVTGYNNVRKTSFTGSSTQISGDDLRKVSQTNILDAMQSFDPSFRLMTNTQFGSDPNALPEMYIRGRSGIGVRDLDKDQLSKSNLENNPNLPTFIMDGFEVSIEKIYDLDPSRIESMTILKDAAATAIYGSRAANGVVVITTVEPKPGEVRVSYNFTGTVEMPDLRDYNLANASEKLEIERLAGLFENSNLGNGMNSYYKKYSLIQRGVDTDWMVYPLQNAFDHKHSLYVEGGTQNLRYGVDASYNGKKGVMKGSGRDQYSVGFSLDYRMKSLQVKNTVSFTHVKSKESPYGSFSDYTSLQPYDMAYDANGKMINKLTYSKNNNRSSNNPLYEATLASYDWDAYDEITNNLNLNWYLTPSWTVRGQFSISRKYSSGEKFVDPLSHNTTVSGDSSNEEDARKTGDLYIDGGNNMNWNAKAFLSYSHTFKSAHNLLASLGWEASSSSSDATNAHYRGFPTGQFHSLNYAAEIYKKPVRTESTARTASVLFTANYTWNDIYLADVSTRFEGSSAFGSNQRWAPFFSAGVGINVHNYEFLNNNKAINKLKVRGSYGRTGKVSFPAYAATTMYETLFDEWYATGFGAVLQALGNNDLTWEKTDKFNVGIETQFLNKRLTVEADYYYERTIDLVNDVSLSNTSGFSSYKNNMGKVLNKGFELQVRADVFRDKNWLVALWGNMAHNTNKILEISDSQRAYNQRVQEFYQKEVVNQQDNIIKKDLKYSVPIAQYEEGQSLTSIWAVKSLGIDPTTGQEIFLNRDGTVADTWDTTQQVVVGNTEPKFNGAVGFNLVYRQLSLYAAFQYEWGGQEYNQTLVDRVENADITNQNVDLRVLTDRWKQPGDIAQFKDIKNADRTTLPTSRFVQDKSYFRLSALTLSYDFKREWTKKYLGMNMLRFEASTRDFINWNSIRQERGLSYPKSWTVDFTIKAQF
ncbi:SusC/RagA family TonB-linked outer membrane protein [Bacteroides caecimuris]|uniref:SusC/RagA family TonB-linked outer membrane protein n=1 Tax=Bacteroides caecimuris TaxID=1796613 RepID=UPI002574718F|nr:SusC/RagA family TonB-linked outer membrane protein [Bacteroides caecimuris]